MSMIFAIGIFNGDVICTVCLQSVLEAVCKLSLSAITEKMNISKKLIFVKLRRDYGDVRLMSAQIQLQQPQQIYPEHDEEWLSAKSFNTIPGPSKTALLRSVLPGGKYYKIQPKRIHQMLKEDYGDLSIVPGMFGKPDIVFSFNPNDYEKVFRAEGTWPNRLTMESIKYFREVEKFEFYKNSRGIAIDNGERWGKTRSAINPVLMQPRTVTQYIKKIDSVSREFIERMKVVRDSQTLELTDFKNDLNRWALESMGVIALDTRLGLVNGFDTNPKARKLIQNMNRFFSLLYNLEMKPNLSRYLSTPNFKEMMKIQTELQQTAINYIDRALTRTKYETDKPEYEKSVLERLIAVDRDIALVMVSDMLMFGVDTTVSALVACLYQIAKNPEKQRKLFTELNGILPTKDTLLSKENMLNLPYLRACIKEALRINPVVMGNSRITKTNLVLSGYQIPPGTIVLMPSQVLQIEEQHFPNPEKFIPERWLRDQTKNSECPSAKTANPFIYLPFGFGPRMCVGKRLAQMEIEVGLARIIRNFKIEYNYPDLEFEQNVINVPKGDLRFKISDVRN